MSKRCGYGCGCGCNRGGGFDPCRVALFLIVLKKAGIISPNTAALLVFLFLLCCGQRSCQSLCCGR